MSRISSTSRSLLLLLLLALAPPLCAQEEGDEPAAQPEESQEPGVLAGTVRWRGKPFPPREVLWPQGSRGHDSILERMLIDRTVLDRRLEVDPESLGIVDVLVTLPGLRRPVERTERVAVTIELLAFEPRILALGPQVEVVVENRDPLLHVVTAQGGKGAMRRYELAPGAREVIVLPAGESVELSVERFPFMSATAYRVGDMPALVTSPAGKFRVRGLPPGEHEVRFRHPLLGVSRRTLLLQPGQVFELELSQNDFLPEGGDGRSPFATEEPAFRIEGRLLSGRDFDAVVAFLRRRHGRFELPRSLLESHALRHVLVPVAASFDHHVDEVARLERRIADFWKRLEGPENFGEVAGRMSEDPEGAAFGPVGIRDIDPWLGVAIFGAAREKTVGPVYSSRGIHLFHVEKIEGEGAAERRSGSHCFFSYDPKASPEARAELARELALRARIEALEMRHEKLVDAIRSVR